MDKQKLIELIVQKLQDNKDELTENFFGCNPLTTTKYCVLDNLLPNDVVEEVFNNFPQEKDYSFRDTFRERKYTFAKLDTLKSPICATLTDALHSLEVVRKIGEITQISDLESDPTLYAGGVSRMDKSHFLNPHIDNSHNADRTKYRRLNILYYVTPDIDENDGGNFELWDDRVTSPVKIASKFNRLVVMETTKTSWHSVDPVLSDVRRCCVSNYYFTTKSPTSRNYYHVTSFTGRPEQTLTRIYGSIDNFLRQTVASITGKSRGKQSSRHGG